jgi:metallo-beta-lactamase family protein
MPTLTFLGAARTVTGSQYLLRTAGSSVLVDSGMFQGPKELRDRNWQAPGFDPARVTALIVTHTHLDHIGRIPRLVKQGLRAPIYCTPATRDLAEVLLKDAAHLQEEDAEYLNRKGLTSHKPALPLFDNADVEAALKLFRTANFGENVAVAPDVSFRYANAGHLLGAASARVRVSEAGKETSILFSGDVGRFAPILTRPPDLATAADYMVVESTYGNRVHETVPIEEQLLSILERTFAKGGVVLVPAFAVGRAQQVIWLMDKLVSEGHLRPFQIYLDSPMAIDATRIYANYPDAHGESLTGIGGRSLLYGQWVHFSRTRAESEKLNDIKGPAVIISSSGMLTGGRILHHCRQRLPDWRNTLVITGYQAENTLGRSLIEGKRTVRIHKGEVAVRAEIASLKGMSGHGDAFEMVRWLSAVQQPPARIFVTHGETVAAESLAAKIKNERGFATTVPGMNETYDLDHGGEFVSAR